MINFVQWVQTIVRDLNRILHYIAPNFTYRCSVGNLAGGTWRVQPDHTLNYCSWPPALHLQSQRCYFVKWCFNSKKTQPSWNIMKEVHRVCTYLSLSLSSLSNLATRHRRMRAWLGQFWLKGGRRAGPEYEALPESGIRGKNCGQGWGRRA